MRPLSSSVAAKAGLSKGDGRDADALFSRHLTVSAISQLVTMSTAIVQGILIARLLGPESRGILALLLNIPALVGTFADLGVRQAATRAIGARKVPVGTIVGTLTMMGIASSLGGVVVAVSVMLLQGFDRFGADCIALALLQLPLRIGVGFVRGVLLGNRSIDSANLARILSVLLVAVLVVAFARSVRSTLLIFSLGLVVEMLLLMWAARSLYTSSFCVSIGLARQLVNEGIKYAVTLFVVAANYRISYFALAAFAIREQQIGVYAVGMAVAELIWQVPTALGTAIFSYAASSADPSEMSNRTLHILRRTLAIGAVVALSAFVVGPLVITIGYGTEFAASGLVLQLLLPGVYLGLVFKILQADLAGRGKPLIAMRIYLLAIVVNLVVGAFLIPRFGIYGAAVATSISYVLGGVCLGFAFSKANDVTLLRANPPASVVE